MLRDREDHLLDAVVLAGLRERVQAFEAVQEEVQADLQLQIPQLGLLLVELALVGLDLQILDLLHHRVERLVHLAEFPDVRPAARLGVELARADLLHRAADLVDRAQDRARHPPQDQRDQHERQYGQDEKHALLHVQRAEIALLADGEHDAAVGARDVPADDHVPRAAAGKEIAAVVAVQVDAAFLHKIDGGQRLVVEVREERDGLLLQTQPARVAELLERHHRDQIRAAAAVKPEQVRRAADLHVPPLHAVGIQVLGDRLTHERLDLGFFRIGKFLREHVALRGARHAVNEERAEVLVRRHRGLELAEQAVGREVGIELRRAARKRAEVDARHHDARQEFVDRLQPVLDALGVVIHRALVRLGELVVEDMDRVKVADEEQHDQRHGHAEHRRHQLAPE